MREVTLVLLVSDGMTLASLITTFSTNYWPLPWRMRDLYKMVQIVTLMADGSLLVRDPLLHSEKWCSRLGSMSSPWKSLGKLEEYPLLRKEGSPNGWVLVVKNVKGGQYSSPPRRPSRLPSLSNSDRISLATPDKVSIPMIDYQDVHENGIRDWAEGILKKKA